jgi:hypothetical protein
MIEPMAMANDSCKLSLGEVESGCDVNPNKSVCCWRVVGVGSRIPPPAGGTVGFSDVRGSLTVN